MTILLKGLFEKFISILCITLNELFKYMTCVTIYSFCVIISKERRKEKNYYRKESSRKEERRITIE